MAAAAASLQFGQQLVASLLPTTLATGAQLVLSPLSAWFALLLLLNGAGPSTRTYNELSSVLVGNSTQFAGASGLDALNTQVAALRDALSGQSTTGNTLSINDAVWTRGIALNPTYADNMQRLFKAKVAAVPDAAPISAWAANVTNNLIKEVVPADLNFNLVLANAIYFKGLWQHPFDKALTRSLAFSAITPANPTTPQLIQVPTMQQTFSPRDANVSLSKVPGKYQALRLPYQSSTGLAAVFVLPDKNFTSIADAARQITGQMVVGASSWAPLDDRLDVTLPRFKVEAKLDLKEALQSMGMRTAFTPQADFSAASPTPLMVTDVLQSVVVQVDEAGTEAAADRAVVAIRSSPPKVEFNRPFLFFLVDTTTEIVLFQGAITDPSSSQWGVQGL